MKRINGLTKAAVLVGLLIGVTAVAGVIKNWSAGDVLTPSDLTYNFNHIHNLMVGGHGPRLIDADVSASAAIQTTKLAGAALIPKAWAVMTTPCTVNGACAVADSNGISSITRTGLGLFTIALSSSRTGAYVILMTTFGSGSTTEMCTPQTQSASSYTISCNLQGTGAQVDSEFSLMVMDN